MKFFSFKGEWINPDHIVSMEVPKLGKRGNLVLSNGRIIEIGVIDFSELRAKLDMHLVGRIYG